MEGGGLREGRLKGVLIAGCEPLFSNHEVLDAMVATRLEAGSA